MGRAGSFEPITCDAILFDLDGALVDSRACVESILQRWATARHAARMRSIGVATTYPASALGKAGVVIARLADLRMSSDQGRLRLYHEGAGDGAISRHREETEP